MRNFDEYMVREIFKEEGIELSDQEIRQLIAEGFMDKMKKWGRNAAMAGAMGMAAMNPAQAQAQTPAPNQINPQQINQTFDGYTAEKPTMSPEQWKQMANQYKGNRHGFVPNPKEAGSWIPAGGADSVRVQGITQVNNDRLEKDDIGLTPWKDGKAAGPTQWSRSGQGVQSSSKATTTPFDGEALARQLSQ